MMNMTADDLALVEAIMIAGHATLRGEFEYAERMFRFALNKWQGQAKQDILYPGALTGLAQVYLLQGRLEEAEPLLQEALLRYEQDFVDDLFGRFSTLCDLGGVNLELGLPENARSFYEQALPLGEKALIDHPQVLAYGCLRGYAKVLRRLQLSSEAETVENRIRSVLGENYE